MIPLKQLIGLPMDPARFLRIATAISGALSSAHGIGPHGDVRPDTLFIDESAERASLGGGPERSGGQGAHRSRYAVSAESLPYVAPERTGRITRASDHRSDLYSLGVVFYELVAGALPFEANGVLEWVHCHIARRPRPLSEHVPELPAPIGDIVMKLLAKIPEERYQTAAALSRDLARCLRVLEAGQELSPFPLGADDVPEQLRIPHKLYGRDAEIAALSKAFERTCDAGAPELVLVTGHPGIGKSALVDELYRLVVRRRGLLVSGKADQYERGVPYAGIVQALDRLVQRLLMESKARLTQWRQQILEAVGENGQVVLDVVPRMKLVLGPQPPVEPLPGNEARNRFERVFRQLFRVLASAEHPVVLFLDDLQWSDPASLSLLVSLLTQGEIRHLLIIGAYRDNEIGAGHPLIASLDEIQKSSIRTEHIRLGPLSRQDVEHLVVDTLRCSADQAGPLAGLIHDKTSGNAFFATQFLKTLEQDGLISFNRERLAWQWDLTRIEAARLTDDVIEMMIHRLQRLPEPTSLVLRVAASIGGEFDVDTLASAHEVPRDELHERLLPAIHDGLLLRLEDGYAFLHDRVQQAAYLLIPEAERAQVHLRIARSLRARTPPAELGDKLFAVANQYNLGAARITDPEEKREVAELNLVAGRKAKASSAYRTASGLLAAGVALLDDASWSRDYDLIHALYREYAECEHLSGNGAEMRRLCATLLEHSRTTLDKQLAYRLLVERSTAEFTVDKAIDACIEFLGLLGIEMSSTATDADVEAEFQKIWDALGDRPIEALLDLPPMTNREVQAAVSLLSVTYIPAWYYKQTLAHLMMARTIYLSIVHGNTGASAVNYATSVLVLIPRFRDYTRGYAFSKVGYRMGHREGSLFSVGTVDCIFGSMAAPWYEHFNQCVRYMLDSLEVTQRSGNVSYLTLASVIGISLMMAAGRRLDEVYREAERQLEILRVVDRTMGAPALLGMQRAVQCLRGLTTNISTLNGGGFEEEAFEKANPPVMAISFYYYHSRKLQARVFAGEAADAAQIALWFRPFLWAVGCQSFVAEGTFYIAIALLGHFDEVDEAKKREYKAEIEANEAALATWAESFPPNFLAMKLLVGAERARVERRSEDALRLYDEAAEAAREHEFVHIEALSKELAGRFCLARGLVSTAGALLRDARACYSRWGAEGKVSQLDRRYAGLLGTEPRPAGRMSGAQLEQVDVLTVVKTCQAISSEIDQSKLLSTLLHILVEHAGAERCHLLVPSDDAELVAASAEVTDDGIDVKVLAPHAALDEVPLPESMIQYVKRTREQVILDDPASQSLFSADPYIERVRPKSVLCGPILRQSTLVAILYLENNLTLGAFSGRRLALLEFITAQTAISMENAALYKAIQQENTERNRNELTLRESEERLRRLIEERESSEATLREKLAIIEQQQQAIRTLSTPIIEVWEGVLTMPVLGTIDASTGAHMMEVLLAAIVRQRAKYVIVDLTAVRSLDNEIADHVVRMVRAVKLLGAVGIVVGIRPEVAQIIVSMGVDLASLTTLANLRQALVKCMALGNGKASLSGRSGAR
jgi:predicted ATPase/GAF domain-containing protein